MEPSKPAHPAYQYGMLLVILGLFAWNIHFRLGLPPGYGGEPYSGFVVVLMLLFNHLAYQFKWPRYVTATLRVLAWSWIAFGFFYLFFWSRVLYA
jgi:hypothetical protein